MYVIFYIHMIYYVVLIKNIFILKNNGFWLFFVVNILVGPKIILTNYYDYNWMCN